MIIDAQVHPYERDHPGRPWQGHIAGPAQATGEELVAAMDAQGVDASILVSSHSLYRYDPSYALDVFARWPGRFGVIRPLEVTAPDIAEQVQEWSAPRASWAANSTSPDHQRLPE